MTIDRRTFLKLSGFAGASLWLASSSHAKNYQVAAYFWPNWHSREAYRPPDWPKHTDDHSVDFGEWGILKGAKPRFAGHMQPKVPAWGYEDESDPKVMARKIDAAIHHGVDAFIFDWYFINNAPYLARALNDGYLKAKNHHRVKFALMWAADNSLRSKEELSPRARFDRLAAHVIENYLLHPSYWKIDSKAYFSIYQIEKFIDGIGSLEEARHALDHFRDAAKARGLAGVHLNFVDAGLAKREDAAALVNALDADSVTSYVWAHPVALKDFPETDYGWAQKEYFQYCEKAATTYGVPYLPNVTMGWDPTPRIAPGKPFHNCGYPDTPILKNNTPANFKSALRQARVFLDKQPKNSRIVTIYAWNEWTEGGYLEPDTVHGMAYLEAIREVFS